MLPPICASLTVSPPPPIACAQVLDTVVLIGLILNADEPPVGLAFTAADVDSNGVLNVSVSHSALGRNDGPESVAKQAVYPPADSSSCRT